MSASTFVGEYSTCQKCGKRFLKRFHGPNKFCSRQCYFDFNKIGRRGSLTRRNSNRRCAGRKKVLNNSSSVIVL